MQSASSYLRLDLLVFVCLAIAGCGGRGSKLTQANYDRITDGMSLRQVEEILGKGEVVKDSAALESVAKLRQRHKDVKLIAWDWMTKSVLIMFSEDKVVFKSKAGF